MTHHHDLFRDHGKGCAACDSVVADAYDAAPVVMAVKDAIEALDAWQARHAALPPVVTGPIIGTIINLREALRRHRESGGDS